jgi:hypothetical protein
VCHASRRISPTLPNESSARSASSTAWGAYISERRSFSAVRRIEERLESLDKAGLAVEERLALYRAFHTAGLELLRCTFVFPTGCVPFEVLEPLGLQLQRLGEHVGIGVFAGLVRVDDVSRFAHHPLDVLVADVERVPQPAPDASAAPEDKAEVYRRLGLRLTYDPGRRVVTVESHLGPTGNVRSSRAPWPGGGPTASTLEVPGTEPVGKSKCRRSEVYSMPTLVLRTELALEG